MLAQVLLIPPPPRKFHVDLTVCKSSQWPIVHWATPIRPPAILTDASEVARRLKAWNISRKISGS